MLIIILDQIKIHVNCFIQRQILLGINNKNSYIGLTVLFWLIIGFSYLDHTPYNHRSHDFNGHITNTSILINEKRLYKPYDLTAPGGETFQPPLYYLISSLFEREAFNIEQTKHINFIRSISVIYGAISLVFMGNVLNIISTNTIAKFLSLILIASTPKFAFVFSTYNNDSLVTMLCIGIISLLYCSYKEWTKSTGLKFFFFLTATLYTKITSFFCIGAIIFYYCRSLFQFKKPSENEIKVLKIVLFSFIAFSPWVIFNNYIPTGKMFPSGPYHESIASRKPTVDRILALPGIVFRYNKLIKTNPDYTHEWEKPWVLPSWQTIPPETKRYDYLGSVFITSIIGEYVFTSPTVEIVWFLLFVNFIICLSSLYFLIKNKGDYLNFFKVITLVAVCEQLISLIPFLPDVPNQGLIDFRYIAWLWVAWGVFHLNSLINSSGYLKKFLYLVFLIGVLLNIYTLQTIEGGFWW